MGGNTSKNQEIENGMVQKSGELGYVNRYNDQGIFKPKPDFQPRQIEVRDHYLVVVEAKGSIKQALNLKEVSLLGPIAADLQTKKYSYLLHVRERGKQRKNDCELGFSDLETANNWTSFLEKQGAQNRTTLPPRLARLVANGDEESVPAVPSVRETAFCPKCGANTRGEAVFCPTCGTKREGQLAFCDDCGHFF